MPLTRTKARRPGRLIGARARLVGVTLGLVFCAVSASSQPPPANQAHVPGPDAATPATAPVVGFRQARFGMTEAELRQAILRDFPSAAKQLARATNPRERTTVLTITADDMLPDAGAARVSYILGYASKRLVQVNIVWAGDGRSAARDEALVAAANALRDNFRAQYPPPANKVVANLPLGQDAILVFRAAQPDGRMVLLLLSGAAAAGRAGRTPAPPPLTLQLSYLRDHEHPDIFRILPGRF